MVTVTTTDPGAAATVLRRTRRPHQYHCSGCGYGVVVCELPASCPMCRGTVWELARTNPMSDDTFTPTRKGSRQGTRPGASSQTCSSISHGKGRGGYLRRDAPAGRQTLRRPEGASVWGPRSAAPSPFPGGSSGPTLELLRQRPHSGRIDASRIKGRHFRQSQQRPARLTVRSRHNLRWGRLRPRVSPAPSFFPVSRGRDSGRSRLGAAPWDFERRVCA